MTSPAVAAPFPGARWLPRSRFRRGLLLAIAYLALTSAFVAARFPIDRLAPRVVGLAEAASGARVAIGELELGLVAFLPELRAQRVDLTWPAGTRLHLDHARVRPAWSLSWLRGDPSLVLSLRAQGSRIAGMARIGGLPGFAGTVTGLDLGALPPALLGGSGAALEGRVDAEIDLRREESGPAGAVALRARDGSLTLPALPMGIPFETLDGELEVGGEVLVTVRSLTLEGPLVGLTGSGTVGHAAVTALAPLSLQGRLEVREPALGQMLAGSGITLRPDGAADLAIGGTLGNPVLGGGRGGAGARSPLPVRTGPRAAPTP